MVNSLIQLPTGHNKDSRQGKGGVASPEEWEARSATCDGLKGSLVMQLCFVQSLFRWTIAVALQVLFEILLLDLDRPPQLDARDLPAL